MRIVTAGQPAVPQAERRPGPRVLPPSWGNFLEVPTAGSLTGDRPWVYGRAVIDVGTRKRSQPAPPTIVFEALTEPERPGGRPWLYLLDDEVGPHIIDSTRPGLVVWSSIWLKRPDAVIRFDLPAAGRGTDLRWTSFVEEPVPDDALLGHLRKRLNQLINAELRYSFGQ